MIRYTLRATIAKPGPAAAAWSRKAADLVGAKLGVTFNVSTRLGGPQEIIFVSEYADLAAFEQAQAKLLGDAEYNRLIDAMSAEGLFLPGTADTAFWLPI
jgi:hypothetical protein